MIYNSSNGVVSATAAVDGEKAASSARNNQAREVVGNVAHTQQHKSPTSLPKALPLLSPKIRVGAASSSREEVSIQLAGGGGDDTAVTNIHRNTSSAQENNDRKGEHGNEFDDWSDMVSRIGENERSLLVRYSSRLTTSHS